jgi:hypothetical protein
MAKKRAGAKKKPVRCKTTAEIKKILAKAQAKVANLQKNQRAGTLAQVELEARLEEITGHLNDMDPWDVYTSH